MRQAERLLPMLPNAEHIVMRNAGHADVLEVCDAALERILAFLDGRPLDTSEIVLPPIHFDVPATLTADCERRSCRDALTRSATVRTGGRSEGSRAS